MEIEEGQIVLCKFYFTDAKRYKNRPVLVFKDNLPFNDFIGIAISSQVEKMHEDEYIVENSMLSIGALPKVSKIMLRKTFVVEKSLLIKIYGSLDKQSFKALKHSFCNYHRCKDDINP